MTAWYAHEEVAGPAVTDMPSGELVKRFRDVMDTINRINNLSGLAALAKRAGELWEEIESRGGEIK